MGVAKQLLRLLTRKMASVTTSEELLQEKSPVAAARAQLARRRRSLSLDLPLLLRSSRDCSPPFTPLPDGHLGQHMSAQLPQRNRADEVRCCTAVVNYSMEDACVDVACLAFSIKKAE